MANRTRFWRTALWAVAIVAATVLACPQSVPAQQNDARPARGDRNFGDRGDRPGRDFRRGGGPGGEAGGFRGRNGGRRGRGPNIGDGGGNGAPADVRPAPATPAPSTPAAAPAASSTSFGTQSDADRNRKWASDIVAKYDKDGNKILEGDELATLKQSTLAADKDGDGKITIDELVRLSTSKSAGTPSNPTPTAAARPAIAEKANAKPTADDTADRVIVNKSRKSYRFKSTKERQQSWRFASKDANGDGQVSMSEYTSIWNDRTAAEFQRYDKDNDGMITPEEVK